jgi:hypothetical protein
MTKYMTPKYKVQQDYFRLMKSISMANWCTAMTPLNSVTGQVLSYFLLSFSKFRQVIFLNENINSYIATRGEYVCLCS